MATKSKVVEAPYDDNGDLMHYPMTYLSVQDAEGRWVKSDIHWLTIAEFDASLQMIGYERGRSAAYFNWVDENGHHYPMFLTDMVDLVMNAALLKGAVKGTWTVRKRGANYGIVRVK